MIIIRFILMLIYIVLIIPILPIMGTLYLITAVIEPEYWKDYWEFKRAYNKHREEKYND